MFFIKKPLDLSILERLNFKPEEFIASDIAEIEEINNNVYDPNVLANLNRTADKAQEIRSFLGCPFLPNSFYRCLKLNRRVGSRDNSQHLIGQAGDGTAPQFGSPRDVFNALRKSGIVFDQLLLEATWFHFSIREQGKNRNEFAHFLSGKKTIIN